MNKLTLIIAFALLTVCSISGAHSNKPITAVDLDALIVAGKVPLILDVRSQDEFADGHIPGAINIPHTELKARIAELESHKNKPIILYCRSGRRAVAADAFLHSRGFTRIIELGGHMLGWQAGGHPVE